MNNFLKDLMKLATELNQANGFDAVMVINEMEMLYDKHVAELKKLAIPHVSVSLPTKDEVSAEGYRIANDAGYNYRRVLREQDHDIYYSGWMDCFDWICKGNAR